MEFGTSKWTLGGIRSGVQIVNLVEKGETKSRIARKIKGKLEGIMQCSWCEKRISILKSMRGEKYCCAEHQQADRAEQRRLAIQRLLESSPGVQNYIPSAPILIAAYTPNYRRAA